MKKPGRGAGSGRRHLSDDDAQLWESTAATIRPLNRKSRVHPAAPAPDAGPPTQGRSRKAEPAGHGAAHPPPAKTHHPAKKLPPIAPFHPREEKKIRAGRREIERRIDLHGLRQSDAHVRLRRFLHQCHADGLRHVLVITGKGGPRRRKDDDDFGWNTEPGGVLRRQVPLWLAEPDLRAIVVSFTSAAIQHGGDGALYVHLRRAGRAG